MPIFTYGLQVTLIHFTVIKTWLPLAPLHLAGDGIGLAYDRSSRVARDERISHLGSNTLLEGLEDKGWPGNRKAGMAKETYSHVGIDTSPDIHEEGRIEGRGHFP